MISSASSMSRTNSFPLWSQYLHRRVMRLLLQHDQHLFQGQFRMFYAQSTLPKIPLFQLYDSYLKLLHLKDELLDDILPRIRRQLSLQNNQLFAQEEAPTRGEIDWSRTIMRTLNETPDLPPLRFDTNQHQRSMTLPENVFVVAILLTYRQALQNILKKDLADEMLNEQERQLLIGVEERIERELAVPYTHALLPEAERANIEQLAEQVRTRLPPGNSAYRDIFHWWEQFNTLHIGKAIDRNQLTLISKYADERDNSWLYELWIALELLHLLDTLQTVTPADIHIEGDRIRLRFTWNERIFFFTYNRQPLIGDEMISGWKNVPGSKPRYTIEREHLLEVRSQDVVIWHESPVIFDASYSSADSIHNSSYAPALQKLLGEMRFCGVQHAALLMPILSDPDKGEYCTRAHRENSVYTEGMSYKLEDPDIRLVELLPGMDIGTLQDRLKALLDDVTSQEILPERPEPACHGIFLDENTINPSRSRPASYTVLCPKPHIGKGVFDLVNDKVHCLKDPRICHIHGQAKLAPFVIQAVTRDALNQQSSDIRARADETLKQAEENGDEGKAEQLRSHIFLGVGRTVEQYVKVRGNTVTLEAYFEEWIFGEYWKDHPRCLAEETRNILLSGAYVWDEYKQTPTLKDWAAPAVQFCRALEIEIKRRLHDHYPDPTLNGFKLPPNNPHMTLGGVKFIYLNRNTKPDAKHNWGLFTNIVVIKSHSDINVFTDMIYDLVNKHVADNRNQLAHSSPIPQVIAQELRDAIIGRKGQTGILCWLAEHLEPKK